MITSSESWLWKDGGGRKTKGTHMYLKCFIFLKKKKKILKQIWQSVNTHFFGGLYMAFIYYTLDFSDSFLNQREKNK